MVYANDQWVQLPVRDLYDSQIMAMAINAAKDMYEKGQQEIKDFTKLYGDFYSPVPGRTEEVYNETLGKVKNVVDAIYAAGGDPLRSPEARALISRTINGVNAGKVNQYKQEALVAQEYLKNRAKAQMEGWYNEDFERAINGGKTLEEWSPTDGIWKSPAPSRFMTQDDIISPLAKALNPEFDAVRTAQANDGYDYKTVSEDRIRQMVQDNLDDLIGKSAVGKYYYNKALDAAKGDEGLARQLLTDQYVNAAKKNTKEDRELNQYKYQKTLADERRQAAKEQAALAYHYKQLENWDFDGDGKLDAGELDAKRRYKEAQIEKFKNTGRYNRGADGYPNIFDEADRKPGEEVGFKAQTAYDNKIDPHSDKIVMNSAGSYVIANKDIDDVVNNGDILSDDFKMFKSGTFSTRQDIAVLPASGIVRKNLRRRNPKTGKMEIVKDKYAYYMKVQLQSPGTEKDKDGNLMYEPVNKESKGFAYIRIKERDANYGELQKKDKSVDTSE